MRRRKVDYRICSVADLDPPSGIHSRAEHFRHGEHDEEDVTRVPWGELAAAAGVHPDLVRLGCELTRAFRERRWPAALATVCGVGDRGLAMLKLARDKPDFALAQWSLMLDTGGQFLWCEVVEERRRNWHA
jgi:hypothetical protein